MASGERTKKDKAQADRRKLTEQHEGLPGYLDNAMPSTPASPEGETGEGGSAKKKAPKASA